MTQRRNDPDRLSNWFDRVLYGIGKRGSSFTDVDAITHDEDTGRFLFQEFKRKDERLNKGQQRLLKGLARKDWCTVWCVRQLDGDHLQWCDVATRTVEEITIDEYRARFRRWWEPPAAPLPVSAPPPTPPETTGPRAPFTIVDRAHVTPITADEINW